MHYLEESQGVTDFSPLSGSPSSLSAPFGRGELAVPTPPSPFHFSHSFCARHLLSKQGRPFANSPHSYMIDNRKPLSGADYFFIFSSACASSSSARLGKFVKTSNLYISYLCNRPDPGGCPVRPCQKPPLAGSDFSL